MSSVIAVNNNDYVWRICSIAQLIMILYGCVCKRAFIGTAIEKAPKTSLYIRALVYVCAGPLRTYSAI